MGGADTVDEAVAKAGDGHLVGVVTENKGVGDEELEEAREVDALSAALAVGYDTGQK